jgi:hypothetical protein
MTSEQQWWWTRAKRGRRRCIECRERIPEGVTFAYCHPEQILCELCVERAGLTPAISKRLKQASPGGGARRTSKRSPRTDSGWRLGSEAGTKLS